MMVDNELIMKALRLLSSIPPSWETFLTSVCNTSTMAMKYSETTSSIVSRTLEGKCLFRTWSTKPTLYRIRWVEAPQYKHNPLVRQNLHSTSVSGARARSISIGIRLSDDDVDDVGNVGVVLEMGGHLNVAYCS
jgi:hypothetical protein